MLNFIARWFCSTLVKFSFGWWSGKRLVGSMVVKNGHLKFRWKFKKECVCDCILVKKHTPVSHTAVLVSVSEKSLLHKRRASSGSWPEGWVSTLLWDLMWLGSKAVELPIKRQTWMLSSLWDGPVIRTWNSVT